MRRGDGGRLSRRFRDDSAARLGDEGEGPRRAGTSRNLERAPLAPIRREHGRLGAPAQKAEPVVADESGTDGALVAESGRADGFRAPLAQAGDVTDEAVPHIRFGSD